MKIRKTTIFNENNLMALLVDLDQEETEILTAFPETEIEVKLKPVPAIPKQVSKFERMQQEYDKNPR